MNNRLARPLVVLCLCSGVALTVLLLGADAKADHEHHEGTTATAEDPHAAHRAAMNMARYSVSEVDYTVPDVRLLDADAKSIDLRELLSADEPVALNFIFTTCTTICPVMTATFSQMQRQLGDEADKVRIISISIDPEYDRPAVLKNYAAQFHAGPNWTFLTGDNRDIVNVLQSFDTYAGSKMNHQPATFLRRSADTPWIRIDGLAGSESLANEVRVRLLN